MALLSFSVDMAVPPMARRVPDLEGGQLQLRLRGRVPDGHGPGRGAAEAEDPDTERPRGGPGGAGLRGGHAGDYQRDRCERDRAPGGGR